jgi:ribosomal protein S17E
MGKTKSKSIRRIAKELKTNDINFDLNFEKNKKILNGLGLTKKLRNKLAGLMTRIKKNELKEVERNK